MKTTRNLFQICLLGAVLFRAFISGAQPVITSQPANQLAVYGGGATFSVMVTGVGPFTYQWRLNGTNLANNIITTVAGNGTTNFSGDGGLATDAGIYHPYGVSLDAANNLYIADTSHQCIRKVDVNGIITTVAGNGVPGYSGDGGPATNAMFNQPDGVTTDAAGKLFVSDYKNNRVRMVDTNGIITTVAGSGLGGFGGDGYPATNSQSQISGPAGVALGLKGEWYICDENNSRIRKVSTNGIMTTVAGHGSRFGGYSGDGGPTVNALLQYPNCVTVDGVGNLLIADQLNCRIRKVGTNGIITTIAGNGTNGFSGDDGLATNAATGWTSGVCVDGDGGCCISAFGFARVRHVDTNGIITTVAGNGQYGNSGDGGPATNANLVSAASLTSDALGNLFIADGDGNRIREVHIAGVPVLALNNVGIANAGNYSVIVTGASGSVTSSVANLALVLPPISPAFTASNGLFTLQWSAASNLTYQMQFTTNLIAPAWVNLGTPVTATSSSVSVTDVLGADSQRFYRVRLLQ